MKSVMAVIAAWVVLFALCQTTGLTASLCGKGAVHLHGEYYRFFTASFLHANLVHLAANCLALYFISGYFHGRMAGWMVVAVGIAGGTLANLAFSRMTPNALYSMGGSVIVFAVIGLMAVACLAGGRYPPFRLDTRYGGWTLGYLVLGNLFNASLQAGDLSTIKIHALALLLGVLLGVVCIFGPRPA